MHKSRVTLVENDNHYMIPYCTKQHCQKKHTRNTIFSKWRNQTYTITLHYHKNHALLMNLPTLNSGLMILAKYLSHPLYITIKTVNHETFKNVNSFLSFHVTD